MHGKAETRQSEYNGGGRINVGRRQDKCQIKVECRVEAGRMQGGGRVMSLWGHNQCKVEAE